MRFTTTLRLGGTTAGDQPTVDLVADDKPRSVVVPDDLAAVIAANPTATERFRSLSYSNQRRHVLAVTGARTEATRSRRIANIIEELATETTHPDRKTDGNLSQTS